MKEVKITPPEGYEIDKENSTFDCIRFKPITKIWRNIKSSICGFSINMYGGIERLVLNNEPINSIALFNNEKEAKSAIAMAKISQIIANDERFGGIITNEEWTNSTIKFIIYRYNNEITTTICYYSYCFLAFHTEKQRDLFLEENEDLVKDYLML